MTTKASPMTTVDIDAKIAELQAQQTTMQAELVQLGDQIATGLLAGADVTALREQRFRLQLETDDIPTMIALLQAQRQPLLIAEKQAKLDKIAAQEQELRTEHRDLSQRRKALELEVQTMLREERKIVARLNNLSETKQAIERVLKGLLQHDG